jgi:hypothetical protein
VLTSLYADRGFYNYWVTTPECMTPRIEQPSPMVVVPAGRCTLGWTLVRESELRMPQGHRSSVKAMGS